MKHTLRILLLTFFLTSSQAWASTPVPVASNNLSSTITTTSTFQVIQAQNNGRIGCTIQNNGTHTMYVYFGAAASATTGASTQLSAGQAVSCQLPNLMYVLKDPVSITGTSGDAFFANFQ